MIHRNLTPWEELRELARLKENTEADFLMWEAEMTKGVPQAAIRYMEGENR